MSFSDTLDQLDLMHIYRTFCLKPTEYTFFLSAHGTFSRLNHMLGHKTGLNKFKKTEMISSTFSDHSGTKLEINYRKKYGKNTNTWRLNNMLLKTNELMKKAKRKSENTLRLMKIKTQLSKIFWMQQNQF